jgi:response regulator RpfG family c-di-GMP phosphodiesterase
MASPKPRVLCVDDEVMVLEGLQLHLRRQFEVVMATSGLDGLAAIEKGEPFAVVISDMRMPGMDGAAFLARVRAAAPNTVRILLTGHADFDAALAAVNHGQLFRFLTKPCPVETILSTVQQAVQQHRLVEAERVLLEQTLAGSIKALTDVLAMSNPVAFGRAARLKRTVLALCDWLAVADRWHIEMAAQLSQLGCITLPPQVAEKVFHGQRLTPAEEAMVARVPALADGLLANIPRLEPVREILAAQARRWDGKEDPFGRSQGEAIPVGARMLRLAVDLDDLVTAGHTAPQALSALRQRVGVYDPDMLEALADVVGQEALSELREVPLSGLKPGMVLAEDLFGKNGVLLVARGYTVSTGLVERLKNLGPGVREPVRVTLA